MPRHWGRRVPGCQMDEQTQKPVGLSVMPPRAPEPGWVEKSSQVPSEVLGHLLQGRVAGCGRPFATGRPFILLVSGHN